MKRAYFVLHEDVDLPSNELTKELVDKSRVGVVYSNRSFVIDWLFNECIAVIIKLE